MIIQIEKRFCKVAKVFSEMLNKVRVRPNGAMPCMRSRN